MWRGRARDSYWARSVPGSSAITSPCGSRGLTERVAAAPEQTLMQLCQWVEAEHDVRVSLTRMWKTLGRLGLMLKKSRSRPPSSGVPT